MLSSVCLLHSLFVLCRWIHTMATAVLDQVLSLRVIKIPRRGRTGFFASARRNFGTSRCPWRLVIVLSRLSWQISLLSFCIGRRSLLLSRRRSSSSFRSCRGTTFLVVLLTWFVRTFVSPQYSTVVAPWPTVIEAPTKNCHSNTTKTQCRRHLFHHNQLDPSLKLTHL